MNTSIYSIYTLEYFKVRGVEVLNLQIGENTLKWKKRTEI